MELKRCSLTKIMIIAYFTVLLLVFPFYFQNGYYDLGEVKSTFYNWFQLFLLELLIISTVLDWIISTFAETKKSKRNENIIPIESVPRFSYVGDKNWRMAFRNVNQMDYLVIGYLFVCLISYFLSPYQYMALWGYHGWRMGLYAQLSFGWIYFLATRIGKLQWKNISILIWLSMIGSLGVFLLGVLNRFSIYPIPMEGANPIFLSTIGNINWYCGYWSIFASLGVGIYMIAEDLVVKVFSRVYCVIAILTGITQGSSGAYLVFGIWILVLVWMAFAEKKYLIRLVELGIWFGLSVQCVRWLYLLSPQGMQFDTTRLNLMMWYPMGNLAISVVGLLWYVLQKYIPAYKDNAKLQAVRLYLYAGGFAIFFVIVLLFIVNSLVPGGINPVKHISAFFFSDLWGNGRGGIWKSAFMARKEIGFSQKMFGVGPDCFGELLYENEVIKERIISQFGNSIVVNAHNEWMNVFMNTGLLGLITYVGLFVLACVKCLRNAKTQSSFSALFLCVLCYMVYHAVSFQQVLSTPFMFMILGIISKTEVCKNDNLKMLETK